ncbi:FmdE family protein [Planococcus rifietoensis]|uniref:FmdE family protein n=1 Tax=Planococcus rifietoensis TaxID=200991 RepID=UPI00384A946D
MTAIQIYDEQELVHIAFDDIRKYHGAKEMASVGVAYRMAEAAFEALYGVDVPERQEIAIQAGQNCAGFRDAFEFITRAETRGKYFVDPDYPAARFYPYTKSSYAFIFSRDTGEEVEVSLKKDFLPAVFYDLVKKERDCLLTLEEAETLETLKKDLCLRALELPLDEVVEVR